MTMKHLAWSISSGIPAIVGLGTLSLQVHMQEYIEISENIIIIGFLDSSMDREEVKVAKARGSGCIKGYNTYNQALWA